MEILPCSRIPIDVGGGEKTEFCPPETWGDGSVLTEVLCIPLWVQGASCVAPGKLGLDACGKGERGGGARRRRVHLAVRSELVLPACLDNMGTGGESLRS